MKAIRKKLTSNEILDEIAEQTGVPKSTAKTVLAAYKDVAQRSLAPRSVGEFNVMGMVKLRKAQAKARTARNPMTGESIKVPARKVVRAKVLAGAKSVI